MSGVLVGYHCARRDLSFAREIEIPDAKGANAFTFLKWFNALRTGNMSLSTDALEGRLEDLLINLRDKIRRDNRTSTRVFDAFRVPKITKEVRPPNVQGRSTFKDLLLCGNKSTAWILIYNHRHLSNTF